MLFNIFVWRVINKYVYILGDDNVQVENKNTYRVCNIIQGCQAKF